MTINLKQEANCFAAAQSAGAGVGVYKDFKEVKFRFKFADKFTPDAKANLFYNKIFQIFLKAYHDLLATFGMIADLEKFE